MVSASIGYRSTNLPHAGGLHVTLKRTMDYLGLGPDDAYDDYDGYDDPEPSRQTRAPREADSRNQRGYDDAEPAVRTVSARPSFPSKDFDASPSRRGGTSSGGTSNVGGNGNQGAGRHDDSGVQIRPSPVCSWW